MAKGCTQREGIIEESFSPVVRFTFILLMLAIAAHLDLELFQMDIKTIFLNGDWTEISTRNNLLVLKLKEMSTKRVI